MQNTGRDDQLSWRDVINHVEEIFSFLIDVFNRIRLTVARHILLFLTCWLISGLIFIHQLWTKSNSFYVKSTFTYEYLQPKIFGDMVERLNAIIKGKDFEKASQLLNLPMERARMISNIKASDPRGKLFSRFYSQRKENMVIEINLKTEMDDDSLRNGLLGYLNNNPFVLERQDLKERLYEEELEYINTKLITIDSLLTALYRVRSGAEGSVSITPDNPDTYELLKFSQELLNRKVAVENSLINPSNVLPIDNFFVLPRAHFDFGSIAKNTLAAFFFGLFLGLGLLVTGKRLKA